jgi:hypothetical protein
MPAFIMYRRIIISNVIIEAYLMIFTLLTNHICELFMTIFIVKVNNDCITIITIMWYLPQASNSILSGTK